MKTFSGWMRDKPAEDPQRPAKSPTECMADGCPLPGVYRQTNETSLCCVHDSEDAHRWPAMTERIQKRFQLFDYGLRMLNSLPGEIPSEALIARVKGMDGPDPKPVEGRRMTVRFYGAQIRSELINECKGPKHEPDGLKALRDTWQKIAV